MRFGEIVGLSWDKVDLENKTASFRRRIPKTGKPKVVSSISRAHAILERIAGGHEVFPLPVSSPIEPNR